MFITIDYDFPRRISSSVSSKDRPISGEPTAPVPLAI
jgi:hypothetical protein